MSVSRVFIGYLWVALATVVLSPASAQEGYALESPLDDHDETKSIRYFGTAKNDRGELLADVTVLLDMTNVSRIFVTDASGRFRAHLPLNTPMRAVTPSCAKEGYVMDSVKKRPGPRTGRASVQVDCVLRRAT